MNPGLIGGIVGCVIGVMGGAVGTYCSIHNTSGPRERRFMIRAAVVLWLAGFLFIGLLLWLPDPYKWFMWIPYSVLLPLGITYGNRIQRRIREQEAGAEKQI